MLTEKRYKEILKLLEKKKSITVTEIKELLNTSESTIRRDLTALDRMGKLVKVFGGAVAVDAAFTAAEPSVAQKIYINQEEKQIIARCAASFIVPNDFIYLDAGTTTGYMIEYITEKTATFVTNAVSHAQRLAAAGFHVLLIGGELKSTTEAVVGNQAILSLQSFHFTKGFFGTNGISKKCGYTTPDYNEAMVKKIALEQSRKRYILADITKFSNISSVTFAEFEAAQVITNEIPPESFQSCKNIILGEKKISAFVDNE